MRISDWSSDVCSSDLAGRIAGVRVNPLEEDGEEDLAAVMEGVPDLVMIPKVTAPEQIARLDAAIGEHEIRLGLAPRSRSEARRGGKARVSKCRSRWSPPYTNNNSLDSIVCTKQLIKTQSA